MILISAVAFTLLSTVVVTGLYGIPMYQLENMLQDVKNPLTLQVLKVIQTGSTIGTFIVPAWVLAYLFHGDPKEYLQLRKLARATSLLWVGLGMLTAVPLINLLGDLNSKMHLPSFLAPVEQWMRDSEDKAAVLTEAFLDMPDPGALLFNLFMIALLPAIGEEWLFRGVVQRLFSEWSGKKQVGIWAAALLFSAMHLQFYGFVPRLLLGALLGYLLLWSGSIWLPMLAHFLNNAAAVIAAYLYQHQLISANPDTLGLGPEQFMVLLASIVLTALFFVLGKRNAQSV
ncbi:MAG: CPBP family intramembrane metalloprotease [Bacteroidia bacterium]|nr:CPBP family intramembrane metalloprotease [Bacteroidia bacterium]